MFKNRESKCKNCGIVFNYYTQFPKKFCSKDCQYKFGHSKETKEKIRLAVKKTYENGIGFATKNPNNQRKRKCIECGKIFEVHKNNTKKLCSKKCAAERSKRTMKGRKITWKDKISKGAKKAYTNSDLAFRHSKSLKGHIVCEETRIKLRQYKGELASNWQGGIAKFPYPYEFNKELKEKIRKRDNYQCQICGMTEEEHLLLYGVSLSVHHIDYNKKNCEETNLVSLCINCHGKTNKNRKHWKEYFS